MKPAVSRRTVLERLRRVLFAPSRLLAVGALTLAFVNENAAFAQHYAIPNVDFTVDAGETLDLSQYVYVPSQNYDSVIKLNGGSIIFSRYATATRYNSNARSLSVQSSPDDNVNRRATNSLRRIHQTTLRRSRQRRERRYRFLRIRNARRSSYRTILRTLRPYPRS